MPRFVVELVTSDEKQLGTIVGMAVTQGIAYAVRQEDAPQAEAAVEDKLDVFMDLVNQSRQWDVLVQISKHPDGVTAAQMAMNLGWAPVNTVTGLLAPGLFRNARKAGFALEELFVVENTTGGAKLYKPGPVLADIGPLTNDEDE